MEACNSNPRYSRLNCNYNDGTFYKRKSLGCSLGCRLRAIATISLDAGIRKGLWGNKWGPEGAGRGPGEEKAGKRRASQLTGLRKLPLTSQTVPEPLVVPLQHCSFFQPSASLQLHTYFGNF